ncbi:hypothetical protein EX895_001304 [Sporisorium graminicola]|uniref:Uncharacterized protein n=1 Tax=Sporisorium graminicola TaxID=280036 RepID=A0A4U7KZZ7_9BASI|nr:hypothetical protein EX895_001304 [Sporisorium graminicola]TKY90006.1 hypothetical protein EX895_001304 [Sporisorium graminicola]
MTSYSFINASAPVKAECILQGTQGRALHCGSYYLTNVSGATQLNGSCLHSQFPDNQNFRTGYSIVGGRDLTDCTTFYALVSTSSSSGSTTKPKGSKMRLLAVFSILAAILPYASAARPMPRTDLGRHFDKGSILERQVQQEFVITRAASHVDGETIALSADVCGPGKMMGQYVGKLTFNESEPISRNARQVFDSTVSYPSPVADSTLGAESIVTYDLDCDGGCGHITFTPFLYRVEGDFRPGGPYGYRRDTPRTLSGAEQFGRFNVVCK